LYVDGDIYAVTSDNLERYYSGSQTSFALDPPPDEDDLRPGHDYRLLAATGVRGDGNLYVWDRPWSRVLVYDKAAGAYSAQYLAANGAPALADLTGAVVDRGHTQPALLITHAGRAVSRPDGRRRPDRRVAGRKRLSAPLAASVTLARRRPSPRRRPHFARRA
jgi:hypothetical protein